MVTQADQYRGFFDCRSASLGETTQGTQDRPIVVAGSVFS